jgi:hypothetical protein
MISDRLMKLIESLFNLKNYLTPYDKREDHLISPKFHKMQTQDGKHAQGFVGQVYIPNQEKLIEVGEVDKLLLSPSAHPRWDVASYAYSGDKPPNQPHHRDSINKSNHWHVCSKAVLCMKHTLSKKVHPVSCLRMGQAGRNNGDKRQKFVTFSGSVNDSPLQVLSSRYAQW